jgi:hypothetical protein
VYNVASSILGVKYSVGGSLIKKKQIIPFFGLFNFINALDIRGI